MNEQAEPIESAEEFVIVTNDRCKYCSGRGWIKRYSSTSDKIGRILPCPCVRKIPKSSVKKRQYK